MKQEQQLIPVLFVSHVGARGIDPAITGSILKMLNLIFSVSLYKLRRNVIPNPLIIMKRYLFIVLLAISFSVQAQSNTANYKYILVPEKFNFLKQVNQYGLNTLTKSFFEEKGFTVYFDNAEIPEEIANDRCKALVVELQENNSMFVTNLTLLLKDCKGAVVIKSKAGKSREKEYETSYNLALKDAFTSLNDLKYVAGNPSVVTNSPTPTTANIAAKAAPVPANEPITTTKPEQQEAILYAQPISNGYQLIDATPKIVMTLLKTSVEDCYISNNGNANGVVLKKNGSWFFEYYKNNVLVSEKLSIKF
ncbi:hypothetical protein QF042_004501 [Pedobacter sp. W3I1]|uniref:hypothetical protein n=1 Tax=Pedobacter sp. W3I1 TaxID=3042291 RepID=UPI002786E2E7|nr:hypothetical protein [Pedobacter sp. W3I1]MDQ0640936.1 hypothetical protein [Pedobacter sp. W3I1]